MKGLVRTARESDFQAIYDLQNSPFRGESSIRRRSRSRNIGKPGSKKSPRDLNTIS